MDNRIEAFRGVLKANGKTLYNGTKVKIKYKSNNILNVKYIGYDYANDLFEFERKSNLLKKQLWGYRQYKLIIENYMLFGK